MLSVRQRARGVAIVAVLTVGLSPLLTRSPAAFAGPIPASHDWPGHRTLAPSPAESLVAALRACTFPSDRAELLDPLRSMLCRPGTASLGITSRADLLGLAKGSQPSRPTEAPNVDASTHVSQGGLCEPVSGVNDRCPEWTQTYDNPGGHGQNCRGSTKQVEWWGADVPVGEVVGSSAVYITGDSCDQTTGSNIATVAYSLSDGHQLWAARYDDPIAKVAVAGGIAVSPDGSTVYVTGVTGVGFDGTTNTADYVTIAYDANTGSRLWQATYDDPDHGFDMATQVAVSPDGARVYVTGASGYWGTTFNPDFATVSYVAATGQQDWVVLYDDPSQSYDWATGIAVVGDNVYVSGNDYSAGNTNYLVAAFRDDRALHTGQLLWGTEYDSGSTDDAPAFGQLEATPTGVYMTGTSSVPVAVPGCRKPAAYDTVAFNPVTGKRLWTATYAGPCYNQAFGLVVSSKSNLVYVTGVDSVNDDGSPLNQDAVTIAYDGTTGTQRWLAEYKLPAKAGAGFAIALSPDGSELFVGGEANSAVQDKQFQTQASALTIAYDAASGSQRWAAQSDDSATAGLFEEDVAYLLAVSLDGRMVLPVGTFHQVTPSPPSTASNTNAYDYGTLAYPSAG